MNKKFFIIFFLSCAAYLHAKTHVSQSFLATDNVFIPQTGRYQNFWHNTDVPMKQKAIEVSVFGGASNNAKGLNKYFGPFDKDSFVVRNTTDGNIVDNFGNQDIHGLNFNLDTATADGFHSVIAFAPKWSLVGANINLFYQRCTKYWMSVSIPLHHVKTNMNITEDMKNSSGGAQTTLDYIFEGSPLPVGTMKDALKQSSLKYGKIDGERKKTGIAEVRLTIGKNWKRTKDFYVQPYVGTSLPTGNKTKSVYLFEPVVGNGGHFALFSGAHFGVKLRESDSSIVFLNGQCTTEYRFANTQMRSIDPGGKPWGRYLAMFKDNTNRISDPTEDGDGTYSFGINLMTKNVKVSPNFTHNSEWQLHIIKNNIDINLGYHLHVQSPQTVKLKESWTDPAIADIEARDQSSTPARGINNLSTGMEINAFEPIRKHELNLDSAGAPFHADSTFFASLSKAWQKEERVFTGNAGASYTAGFNNATLKHWMIWSSLGVDF